MRNIEVDKQEHPKPEGVGGASVAVLVQTIEIVGWHLVSVQYGSITSQQAARQQLASYLSMLAVRDQKIGLLHAWKQGTQDQDQGSIWQQRASATNWQRAERDWEKQEPNRLQAHTPGRCALSGA